MTTTTKRKPKQCKDCVKEGYIVSTRAAPYPGPRCFTHHKAFRKAQKLALAQKRVTNVYEISAEEYDEIFEFQGGCCPICLEAKGVAKRLAVDHDHRKPGCEHPPDKGCRKCVRGLLCGRCNQMIGMYGIPRLIRAIKYLQDPPAQHVLNPPNTLPTD